MTSSFTASPAVPSKVLEEIEGKIASGVAGKVLQEYTNGELKLSMWIPSDLAGRVIGKKGTVITNLQRETKTRLINALPRVGESLWIAVVIIGELKNVFDACKAITEIVENEVDDVVLEFTINYRKPFFLYGGRKFGILKRISADTNVRIFFPEFNPKTQAFKDAQPMSLEGNSENVKRAVSMFEKEALIYQYVQANKTDRHGDAASVGSRDSESKEAKPSRRTTTPHVASIAHTATGSGNAAQPSTSGPSAPTAASTEEVSHAEGGTRGKSRVVDSTGAERILSGNDARAPRESKVRPALNVAAEKASGEGAGERDVAEGAVDGEGNAVPRAPVVKLEKIINIPTTLVGLLLSKRPKAKNTTINVMQLMTHTIISKMPPAGILPGSVAAAGVPKAEGSGEGEGAVDAEAAGAATEGGAEGVAAETGAEQGEKAPAATRRRRTVSDEDRAEGVSDDASSDADDADDAEEGEEGEGTGSEDSIGGSDIESEEDNEGSDEADFVDAVAEPVTFVDTETGAIISGEAGVEGVGAETGAEASADGAAGVLHSAAVGTSLEDRKTLKRLMIAESEKLGFVSFRVVGYYQENVDMVVEALQNIIKGDRIMEVCEKLKGDARSLKWPPKEALRERRALAERRERFDKNGVPREPRERPERPERPDRADRVDGERPSKFKPREPRDPNRPERVRKPKRGEYAGEDAGAAEGAEGAAAEGTERVSRYKGKKPFREVREIRDGDAADGGEAGAATGYPKRAPRGPPKLGEDGKPRPPRVSKFALRAAAAAGAAPTAAPTTA